MTEIRRPKVGIVSCYFPLFEQQMPAGFRDDREATARGYAELLRRDFDVIDAGMLASEADGDSANVVLREARPDVVVYAPSMAAPPSYAMHALAGIDAPLVVWNGPTIDRLPDGLTQSEATINSSQVAAVMLANPLVRERRPFVAITASPADPAGVEHARPHRAGGGGRVAPPRRLGAPGRRLAAGLPGRRVDRGRAGAARSHRERGHRRPARPRRSRTWTRIGSAAASSSSRPAGGRGARGPPTSGACVSRWPSTISRMPRTPSRPRSIATRTCCAGTPPSESPPASALRS